VDNITNTGTFSGTYGTVPLSPSQRLISGSFTKWDFGQYYTTSARDGYNESRD